MTIVNPHVSWNEIINISLLSKKLKDIGEGLKRTISIRLTIRSYDAFSFFESQISQHKLHNIFISLGGRIEEVTARECLSCKKYRAVQILNSQCLESILSDNKVQNDESQLKKLARGDFCYLPQNLERHYKFLTPAFRQQMLNLIEIEAKGNRNLVLMQMRLSEEIFVVNNPILKKLYFEDRGAALASASANGMALLHFDPEFRKDHQIVEMALSSNGRALRLVDDKFKNDPKMVKLALQNGGVLGDADEGLCGNRDLVLFAVGIEGMNLLSAKDDLNDDEELVKIAVGQNPEAIRFVSGRWKKDLELVLSVVKRSPNLIKYAHSDLYTNLQVHEALHGKGFNRFYLPSEDRYQPLIEGLERVERREIEAEVAAQMLKVRERPKIAAKQPPKVKKLQPSEKKRTESLIDKNDPNAEKVLRHRDENRSSLGKCMNAFFRKICGIWKAFLRCLHIAS